jgi:hypothetical protein
MSQFTIVKVCGKEIVVVILGGEQIRMAAKRIRQTTHEGVIEPECKIVNTQRKVDRDVPYPAPDS